MIKTRLTEARGIEHPIIQAPMAFAAGGKLAAAVSQSGGLGLIGGGYGDADWLDEQFSEAGNQPVGCGFITWSLAKQPELLTKTLERNPSAIFLSFADPEPFVEEIKQAGTTLICQVQTLKHARHAADCGADIIIAQGTEAGGHGAKRATTTLVPEVADMLAKQHPDTLLVAAGGIGDGRGLAASLMLGADGVLVGSRFWAATEALVGRNMHQASIDATGDDTIRSSVMDIARRLDWPGDYTCRVLQNPFTDRWHDDLPSLIANADEEAAKWRAAWQADDPDDSNTFVGEVTGLIRDIKPASEIVENIMSEAEDLLKNAGNRVS
ncbi:MAG: nitronate monooxygenase [Rhizobiaceae bacterium]|nr:nitronate monooxygenase [Rhizobiaceae bacterium]